MYALMILWFVLIVWIIVEFMTDERNIAEKILSYFSLILLFNTLLVFPFGVLII